MKTLLSILFSLIVLSCYGQATTNDVILVKEIPVKKYRGLDYEITAWAKCSPLGRSGKSAFSLLQIGKTEWDFLEFSRKAAKVVSKDSVWQKITITGKIELSATRIWLYLLTYGNGDFYFDNLEFKVRYADGALRKIEIENGSFEASTEANPARGLRNTKTLAKKYGVSMKLNLDSNPAFHQTLQIQSRNAKPDERIFYGHNIKAGNYLPVNGIKLYYEVYGEGEPLILLHGNGGSISSFSKQINEFSKFYKVIAVDTRGQGNSIDTVSSSFTYEQFAADIKVLLDNLHLKKVNMLGWSDGGNTSLILASRHPDYVKQLVIMGANLNASETAVNRKMIKTVQRDVWRMKKENQPKTAVTIRLLEMLLKEPHIQPESLQHITAKTLVMAGERDEILESHTRLIADHIIHSVLIILKGQGHFVVQENPEVFNRTVLEFLRE